MRISLKSEQVDQLIEHLHQAYARNHLRLVKQIHTILYAVEMGRYCETVGAEVAA